VESSIQHACIGLPCKTPKICDGQTTLISEESKPILLNYINNIGVNGFAMGLIFVKF